MPPTPAPLMFEMCALELILNWMLFNAVDFLKVDNATISFIN